MFRCVLVYRTLMPEDVLLQCTGFLHHTISFRHHNQISVVHRNPWVLLENEDFGLRPRDKDSHTPQLLKITHFDDYHSTPAQARHTRSKQAKKARNKAHAKRYAENKARSAATSSSLSKTHQPPPKPPPRPPQPKIKPLMAWGDGHRAHLIRPGSYREPRDDQEQQAVPKPPPQVYVGHNRIY